MKKLFAIIIALTTICQVTNAQCGKKVKWTSAHTKFVDSSGNTQREMDESVEITIANSKVNILPHGATEDEMNGPVTDYVCQWTDKKNGNTSFKSVITDPHGDIKNVTVSIKGTGEKISIEIQLEEMDKLKVLLDNVVFEEMND